MRASADVSPVVAADARAERTGARLSRAVVDGPEVSMLIPK
jgi:hypothetical protein